MPCLGVQSKKASLNIGRDVVFNNRISVSISSKYLESEKKRRFVSNISQIFCYKGVFNNSIENILFKKSQMGMF